MDKQDILNEIARIAEEADDADYTQTAQMLYDAASHLEYNEGQES